MLFAAEEGSNAPDDGSRPLHVLHGVVKRFPQPRIVGFLARNEPSHTLEVTEYGSKRLIQFVSDRRRELAHHRASRGNPELCTRLLQASLQAPALNRASKNLGD